jgi:hypothetical protein
MLPRTDLNRYTYDPVTGHYLLRNGYRAYNPTLMRSEGANVFARRSSDSHLSTPRQQMAYREITVPNSVSICRKKPKPSISTSRRTPVSCARSMSKP